MAKFCLFRRLFRSGKQEASENYASMNLSHLSDYLEEPGEPGVPVRDVLGPAVHQGGDDVAQGGQGEVDLGGLLQSVPSRLSLALSLTAGKVNQVQFSLEIFSDKN